MENEDKKVLDLSMEAGRILLDAGAEILRVEETIPVFFLQPKMKKERCMPV